MLRARGRRGIDGVRLRTLSGLDAGFLYLEASGTPMHVGSLMLLRPPKRRGYELHRALKVLIAERLPKARALKRVLIDAPLELGHPMWGEAARIDIDHHVRAETLPRPGSMAQLLRRVAELHADLLPRDRPLWQLVVIAGLASGETALYSKIHHALLDGQGGVALAQVLLDLAPRIPKRPTVDESASATRLPGTRARAQTAVRATTSQFARLLRALPAAFRLARVAVTEPGALGKLRESVLLAPKTAFNVHIGRERALAVASIDLARVKRVARGHGVSLNDVVLAMVAHALREWLTRRATLPDEALVVGMPVSLRGSGDGEANNQVSMAQCPLPTHLACPLARLRAIHAATAGIKQRVGALRELIPTDFPGLAAPLWAAGLSRLWARGRIAERLPALANLVVSNVPGPPVELFLAGARLLHHFPVSIVTHGLALNVTAQSYGGFLEIGAISAKDVVARPDAIVRALERGLATLERKLPA
ncbi:MAG: diacylglycerol O-acyltransferase [Lysobacterales bacterium]|nr:putative diacylglycerol O-acyltransferase [Xanthomonadales bacterium]